MKGDQTDLRGKAVQRPDGETEPMDMWYCEAKWLVLRAGQLYRFRFDPTCASCMALKPEHDESYPWLAMSDAVCAAPAPEAPEPDDKGTP